MDEVKGQGSIVHPVSNWCTSLSLHVNWTNHSRDMSNRVFDLEKNIWNFEEKFTKKNPASNKITPKSNQAISMA